MGYRNLDLNDFGATKGCVPLHDCVITNGTYLLLRRKPSSDNGSPLTTTPSATTRNLVLYMVSPTLFYVLDTDTGGHRAWRDQQSVQEEPARSGLE